MAQKLLVQMVDDLDGSTADDVTTVTFGLDGVDYEIDLTSTNAELLRKGLGDFIEAGRRTGGRLKRGARPAGAGRSSGEAGKIREWALGNGYELSGRGRLPSEVVDAYHEAQKSAAPKRRAKKA